MENENKKIAIIGAGIAGIASAVRLACKGYDISVYEANEYAGGKLTEIKKDGYRFDAGPSLFTLPHLVDELFLLAGENPKAHFTYQKLAINCRYYYEDGTSISAFGDKERLLDELNIKTGESRNVIDKHLKKSAFLYDKLSELFMYSSLNDWRIYFSKKALSAYLNFSKLGFFKTMNKSNKETFSSPKLVQLFNRYATYNGSDPYKTPATMNIIPHLEMSIGAYFPHGGMHSITKELVSLAERCGVRFNYKTPIDKIVVKNKVAIGLSINGAIKNFDHVISNVDIVNSYKRLLPETKPPKFLLNQPKSSSALIFYWGITKEFKQLDVHNIFFSKNYKKEFQQIFDEKTIDKDPTVYINITSKLNPSDAPQGCENWFVMINTPNNQGQDWDKLIKNAKSNILAKISRLLGEDIDGLIATEQILDPRTIESRTGSALGALYGNSSNNLFSAFLRHTNKSQRIQNLYFCGGSVHPGGGIPMCLSSAKILDRYFD